ncbi:MAG: adenosylmethionine decarboxylase [Candidatus Omnitrophica bacterium]|nr:adenosylmethionine decarboxylase [Candidatus Omnitrophota bacterium]
MKKEYCSSRQDIKYAGTHLLIELWDGRHFSSLVKIRKILKDSVKACQATLLKISLHKFSPYSGISGVAVISESHLSIHTWPEYKYAAMDIFVCGNVDPYKALKTIKQGFRPKRIQVVEVKRGIM